MKAPLLTATRSILLLAAGLLPAARGDEPAPIETPPPEFQAPPGFVVERVAGPPLVRYPLFAAADDQGRLYVAEGTGTNLPGEELVPKKLGRITRLDDTDGDGKFDTSQVFADELVFPQGVLWHDGAVYACSHPSLWRFEDTNGDGRADRREEIVSRFNFNGNGCDIHGPFLGPDGWLYWTDGRHGYKIECEGKLLEGFASRIWRCRTDGTGIERLAGGGFDNPVELAFLPGGELIGTMDQGPGDCLLHYVEGGVYPMEHPCLEEFPMTGPLLGAVRQYSAALPVALCGMCRYRSAQLGAEYQDTLFTAQFNVHRIEQHTLVRDGATFRSIEKDFITSNDYSVHLSDVWEDADGSLMFIDMGAWFNYGCPTSKIARPEILGAIYRVRRQDAPPVSDPWGKSLNLADRSIGELIALLDDPRPAVRDQVIARLAQTGAETVPKLAALLRSDAAASAEIGSVEARRSAVWTLCRIEGAEARAAVRSALGDPDSSVRQVAAHAAGIHRDAGAMAALGSIAVDDEPSLRLKAAEALGRLGRSDAVPILLEGMRRADRDRFLEHSLIYALIQINDAVSTLAALDDPHPRVRQAGLMALDQMPAGELTQDLVAALLDTDDLDLREAALAVMSRHAGWSDEVVGLLGEWLAGSSLTPGQERCLAGALLAFSGEETVQQLVARALAEPGTARGTRLLLLRVMARLSRQAIPPAWLDALGQALAHADSAVRREAVSVIKALAIDQFDQPLLALSKQDELPAELRVAALDCLAQRLPHLDAQLFALLTGQLADEAEALVRVAAARTLGSSPLDDSQLLALADQVAAAGPMLVPLVTPAFARSRDGGVGLALLAALRESPGAEALSADDLEQLLKSFPPEVRAGAQPLLDRLAARPLEQAAYLAGLTTELLKVPGDAERGREVFFSKKVACYACHRVPGGEGNVGPDLSQVGRFRTTGDLLESIVFPSSSIVPQFRSYTVSTADGRVVSGMIVRETSDTIHLRTAQLAEAHLARQDVEQMAPADISIMPQGLEKTMSRQELSDLIEFLYRLR